MVPIFVFLKQICTKLKNTEKLVLKNTFCAKKRMQIFFSCQNNQIYLKLTMHFIDCSEKDKIMQK